MKTKRLQKTKKDRHLTLRISDELREWIVEEANRLGVSKTDIARMALMAKMRKEHSDVP